MPCVSQLVCVVMAKRSLIEYKNEGYDMFLVLLTKIAM